MEMSKKVQYFFKNERDVAQNANMVGDARNQNINSVARNSSVMGDARTQNLKEQRKKLAKRKMQSKPGGLGPIGL
jgi:hypothetical protein